MQNSDKKTSLAVQPFSYYNPKIRPCYVPLWDIVRQRQPTMKMSDSELHTDPATDNKTARDFDSNPKLIIKQKPINHQGNNSPLSSALENSDHEEVEDFEEPSLSDIAYSDISPCSSPSYFEEESMSPESRSASENSDHEEVEDFEEPSLSETAYSDISPCFSPSYFEEESMSPKSPSALENSDHFEKVEQSLSDIDYSVSPCYSPCSTPYFEEESMSPESPSALENSDHFEKVEQSLSDIDYSISPCYSPCSTPPNFFNHDGYHMM